MPGAARPMLERLEERLTPSTLPDGFSESLVANNLHEPTAMEFAPDGRLFVAEEGGNLRVIKDGTLLETPFLSLSVDSSGERGLLVFNRRCGFSYRSAIVGCLRFCFGCLRFCF